MYFFGGDANEVEGGGGVGEAMSIGVALSNDGLHWGRVEGEHSSGAVLEPNEGQLFVGWPQAERAPPRGGWLVGWVGAARLRDRGGAS
jgi:hypothetical protein